MKRTVGIGHQNYNELIESNAFYIDKTQFIKEWWENLDVATLITRPRRFGKTLTMSMVEIFSPRNIVDEAICLKDFPYGRKNLTERCREHGLYFL